MLPLTQRRLSSHRHVCACGVRGGVDVLEKCIALSLLSLQCSQRWLSKTHRHCCNAHQNHVDGEVGRPRVPGVCVCVVLSAMCAMSDVCAYVRVCVFRRVLCSVVVTCCVHRPTTTHHPTPPPTTTRHHLPRPRRPRWRLRHFPLRPTTTRSW